MSVSQRRPTIRWFGFQEASVRCASRKSCVRMMSQFAVTDGLMFCDLLGAAEDGVETLRAELRAEDFRFVARAKFAADFCRAFIVAEDDDFDVGMEEFQDWSGLRLDHVDVTAERFGSGEEGEHQARFPASVEMFDLRRTNPPSA